MFWQARIAKSTIFAVLVHQNWAKFARKSLLILLKKFKIERWHVNVMKGWIWREISKLEK